MREPMNQNYQLTGINIELTTCCPLRCPQCYCSLEGGRHIPLETAVNAMKQARELGATHVELSGGETMCYPHLYEAVQAHIPLRPGAEHRYFPDGISTIPHFTN